MVMSVSNVNTHTHKEVEHDVPEEPCIKAASLRASAIASEHTAK